MQNKNVVIICALIAVCSIIYLGLPSSQNTSEPPKPATSKASKQLVKNSGKPSKPATPKPQKQRVVNNPQIDNTTAVEQQPSEIVRPISRPTLTTTIEDASRNAEDQKKQEFEQRMQDFKEKYEWSDRETMNVAEHLINIIPEQFRDSGLTATMKNLDQAQQQGGSGTVDEAMLLQSVEKIMPEQYRPQLQGIIEKFKAEHANDRR